MGTFNVYATLDDKEPNGDSVRRRFPVINVMAGDGVRTGRYASDKAANMAEMLNVFNAADDLDHMTIFVMPPVVHRYLKKGATVPYLVFDIQTTKGCLVGTARCFDITVGKSEEVTNNMTKVSLNLGKKAVDASETGNKC